MRQPRRDADLAGESLRRHRLRDGRTEDFDGDVTVVFDVMGEIDNRMPPEPMRSLQAICRQQCVAHALEECGSAVTWGHGNTEVWGMGYGVSGSARKSVVSESSPSARPR